MTATDAPIGLARANAVHVVQGEYAVTADSGVVLCTLLGSCVSACIRDPMAGVGGLNHFLLPDGEGDADNLSYGVNAMELLINDLLRRGARRDRFEAKLFGGARMIRSACDIGAHNADFARRFLENEKIPLMAESLGGLKARRIEFWPVSGRTRQQLIHGGPDLMENEHTRRSRPTTPENGSVELF